MFAYTLNLEVLGEKQQDFNRLAFKSRGEFFLRLGFDDA